MRRIALALVALFVSSVGIAASPIQASGGNQGSLRVSVDSAPVAADGDIAGAVTDIVVAFRDPDPSVPGIGLKEGGTIRVQLPDGFVNTGSLPVADSGSMDGCGPPVVTTCSTAVIVQGWPQSPVVPFPGVAWDEATNSIILTAKADRMPAGPEAPGPKVAHLILIGFRNPETPGRYPIRVEIQPDPDSDDVLRGTGRLRIKRRTAPHISPNSQANPGPPFANTLFQTLPKGEPSRTMAFYLWDRDHDPHVGVDFPAGSQRVRPIRDADGRRVGWVRAWAPPRARDWSLESGGPSTEIAAFVTGAPTGRLTAVLHPDPAVAGTYRLQFRLMGAKPVLHIIEYERRRR